MKGSSSSYVYNWCTIGDVSHHVSLPTTAVIGVSPKIQCTQGQFAKVDLLAVVMCDGRE